MTLSRRPKLLRTLRVYECGRCEGVGYTREGEDCIHCGNTGEVQVEVFVGRP